MDRFDVERVREDGYYSVKCPQCKKWFEGRNSNATFCSSSCRSRWHRGGLARQQVIDNAIEAVKRVIDQMSRFGGDEYEALQKIRTLCDKGLASAEN